VDDLWTAKSEGVGLIFRAISFQDFQLFFFFFFFGVRSNFNKLKTPDHERGLASNLCDPPTLQTDRQTDGRTDREHAIGRPRFAHQAVNKGREGGRDSLLSFRTWLRPRFGAINFGMAPIIVKPRNRLREYVIFGNKDRFVMYACCGACLTTLYVTMSRFSRPLLLA